MARTATPTSTPSPTIDLIAVYDLVGTVNGAEAEGQLALRSAGIDFNLEKYLVVLFEIGPYQGSGTAQFFTLFSELSMTVTIDVPRLGFVTVEGEKADIREGIADTISDFTLSGPGLTITFSATRRR